MGEKGKKDKEKGRKQKINKQGQKVKKSWIDNRKEPLNGKIAQNNGAGYKYYPFSLDRNYDEKRRRVFKKF
jgi:cellobiose phosphorylase